MARESRQAEVQQPPMSQAALRSKVAEDARPGDVPGSERIISVTEKVVDSTTDTVGEAVGSGETYATPQRASQGWTARRADAETVR